MAKLNKWLSILILGIFVTGCINSLVVKPFIKTSEAIQYNEEQTLHKREIQEKVKVTIPEGFNVRQIADRLEENDIVSKEAFLDLAKKGNFDYWFLKDVPYHEDKNFYRLEGFLFPATYQFQKNSSAEEVIHTMLKRFDTAIVPYKEEIMKGEYNLYDIVRMASVVEREAKAEQERPIIAGVFYNRLERNMKLQSCATIQYLFEEQHAIVTLEDLKIDSPFNTYKYQGLPLGAISNPGESSLRASIYPDSTDYLYFVAIGDTGRHKFSRTYQEHVKNIMKYRD